MAPQQAIAHLFILEDLIFRLTHFLINSNVPQLRPAYTHPFVDSTHCYLRSPLWLPWGSVLSAADQAVFLGHHVYHVYDLSWKHILHVHQSGNHEESAGKVTLEQLQGLTASSALRP